MGAMLAPEGRETGCRESTESSVDTGSGTKGDILEYYFGVVVFVKVSLYFFFQRENETHSKKNLKSRYKIVEIFVHCILIIV